VVNASSLWKYLSWLLEISVLEYAVSRRCKEVYELEKWPIVSACHAGRLADNQAKVSIMIDFSIIHFTNAEESIIILP
jgi:hypothetical protein